MANYSFSVCLTKLDGAKLQTATDGKLYVCIPVEEADLYFSQNTNNVYLSLNMWESRNGVNERGETHGIKQNFSQARRTSLGDAAKQKPYLGNAKEIVPRNQSNTAKDIYNQQAPQGYQQPTYQQAANPFAPDNNIPF